MTPAALPRQARRPRITRRAAVVSPALRRMVAGRRVLGVCAALLTSALLARPAHAQPPDIPREDLVAAEAKATEAKAFFRAGLHAKAAQGFMEAFALSREPALMFNAARSYEEAGQPREAAALFEQYLKLPGVTDDGRADARSHLVATRKAIASAEAAAKATAAKAAAKDTPDKNVADRTKPTPAKTPAAPAAPPAVTRQPERDGPIGGRTLSWTLAGTGGALELLALLLWLDARGQVSDANSMSFATYDAPAAYRSKVDAAKRQRGSAIVFASVGAPLLGWGVYRLATASPADKRSARGPRLAPTVLPSATGTAPGLVFGGRW